MTDWVGTRTGRIKTEHDWDETRSNRFYIETSKVETKPDLNWQGFG